MNHQKRATALALLALPALSFWIGALATRAALVTIGSRHIGELGQALPVVDNWGPDGSILWAIFACASSAGALALPALRRCSQLHRRHLVACIVAAAAALGGALAWPVSFSSDVYAYAVYGDLAAHNLDPYQPIAAPLRDAITQAAGVEWGRLPICVYGPAFVWIARSIVEATAAHGIAATLLGFRCLSMVAFLIAIAAFHAASFGWSPQSRFMATAALALNPVALWSVAEGHNDALMLAPVLIGVALGRRGFPFFGGLLVALAALVKAPALLAAAGLALWPGSGASSVRRRAGVATGTLIVAIASIPLERGIALELAHHVHSIAPFGFPGLAAIVVGQVAPALRQSAQLGTALALIACFAAAGFAARGIRLGAWAGVAGAALALWLALPNPYPWYVIWVLPIAALTEGPVGLALAIATFSCAVRYLPDMYGPLDDGGRLIVTLAAATPLVALVPAVFGGSPRKVPAVP